MFLYTQIQPDLKNYLCLLSTPPNIICTVRIECISIITLFQHPVRNTAPFSLTISIPHGLSSPFPLLLLGLNSDYCIPNSSYNLLSSLTHSISLMRYIHKSLLAPSLFYVTLPTLSKTSTIFLGKYSFSINQLFQKHLLILSLPTQILLIFQNLV